MYLALSISALFISVLQLINQEQFLNITPLSLLSACLAANNYASLLPEAVPAPPLIVILPLTSMDVSL